MDPIRVRKIKVNYEAERRAKLFLETNRKLRGDYVPISPDTSSTPKDPNSTEPRQ